MTYTVKAGDTLSSIARDFYGNANAYQSILAANPSITNANLIYEGQILQIPSSSSSAPDISAAPSSAPSDVPSDSTTPSSSVLSMSPELTKTMWVILALLAAGVGFYLMKRLAENKGLAETAPEETK